MNFAEFGIASVAAITVICYLFAMGLKAMGQVDKWIPAICGALGGVLGLVGLYIIPDFPASDALNAIAVGIVSGGAATWANQIVKQLGKDE